MKRSLERRFMRRWDTGRPFSVVVLFAPDAFPDAPTWHPGPGFRTCIDDSSWVEDNGDGTWTGVAAYVGDDDETWTVHLTSEYLMAELYDKPRRVQWVESKPEWGTVLSRTPSHQHPVDTVRDHWEALRDRWGFVPRTLHRMRAPYGPGKTFTEMRVVPEWDDYATVRHTLSCLHRTFACQVRLRGDNYGNGVPKGPAYELPDDH